MRKVELVDAISEETGVDKKDALAVVESFMNTVKNSVANKEGVFLRGFGTFKSVHRPEQKGRNISKGIEIVVPARDMPKFKPSKTFVALLDK